MKRLVHCVLVSLLFGGPGLCLGQAQPAFTIHGDDSAQADNSVSPAQPPKPQVAPAKVESAPTKKPPAQAPPS